MTAHDDHFGEFGDHTELKHLVLTSYLRAWAAVSISPRAGQRGWFIDAFAGEGKDATGKYGSPILACQVAREVQTTYPSTVGGPRLRTFAIERRKAAYDALVKAAENCVSEGYVNPLFGTLDDHLDAILGAGASDDPRLFFLDPFGIKGLSAETMRTVLRQKRTEILLLFHDLGANRLHGAATKQAQAPDEAAALSLFDEPVLASSELDTTDLGNGTGSAAEAILRTAFGEEAYARAAMAVARAPFGSRQATWRTEYVQMLRELGAEFVVHFSVRDRGERHRYYLVHASTHRAAIHKMKEAIQTATSVYASDAEQELLSYRTTIDVTSVISDLRDHFSGRTVRWVDRNDRDTIKAFLVERTDALMSDMPVIQAAMQARGWLVKGRPATYSIPLDR